MRKNTLKEKLVEGKAVFGVMVTFPAPQIVEMLGYMSLSHRLVGELSNTGVGGMRLNRGWPVQFHRPLVDPQKGRLLS